ncbi:phage integrase N-terminal SAM-like domain-containing protein, partial [Candidatus Gracilibacteria bacterium]|nr:phage integrase N-terminal SAM-like domain-containing protein [Candidatus Gracilibacteria bacterium]
MTEVIKSDLINEISNNLNSISLEQFSKDQLEKIAKLLYLDKAKEKLNNEANKVKFNYEEVKETWLKEFRAKNTKLIYKKSLSIFKNYLEEKGLHILDVKAKDIDGFITVLNNIEELSNSTKRLYITAVSSFFSKLQRWEHIDFNYFKGSKLPKKERSRELKVPSSQDVETIRKTLLGYLEYKG